MKEKAAERALALQAEKERLESEMESTGSRGRGVTKKATINVELRKIQQQEKKVAKEEITHAERVAGIQREVERIAEAEKKADELEAAEAKKKEKLKRFKRNNPDLLALELTPRSKYMLEGDSWKPPMRVEGNGPVAYAQPGEDWKKQQLAKAHLLLACQRMLTSEHLLQPMSFVKVMEILGADDPEHNYDFDTRVFVYLCALVLRKDRYVSDILCCPVFS